MNIRVYQDLYIIMNKKFSGYILFKKTSKNYEIQIVGFALNKELIGKKQQL